MSAADNLIDALADDDDDLRMDLQAYAERDALRAELSTLKARRCDGCAHYVDISTPAKRYGMCRSAENEDAPACVDADRPFALLVDADHYCAAFVAP